MKNISEARLKSNRQNTADPAFTLMELLVVIAIIAIRPMTEGATTARRDDRARL
jgi:prepilin-type N-terminal cleavage/methylation domain-containing protein